MDRDTSTLSGGETFLASLALALGLANVVTAEAGGTRIEALFVDEGFGSLDEETLDEVMTVLDGLREEGRMVGIVSHVAELKSQRIPAQIRQPLDRPYPDDINVKNEKGPLPPRTLNGAGGLMGRVADAMFQFRMLSQPFHVSTMLN